MRLLEKFLKDKTPELVEKECAAPGNRAADRFAGQLSETIARINQTHGWEYRAHPYPCAQLRRAR